MQNNINRVIQRTTNYIKLNTDLVDDVVPMVAAMMMYEMVVQNIAISVPLGMATVGFWEGEDNVCMWCVKDTGRFMYLYH